MWLGGSFEVSPYAQALPSVEDRLLLAACGSRCRTLSSSSSTMSAFTLPCFQHRLFSFIRIAMAVVSLHSNEMLTKTTPNAEYSSSLFSISRKLLPFDFYNNGLSSYGFDLCFYDDQ